MKHLWGKESICIQQLVESTCPGCEGSDDLGGHGMSLNG